MAQNKTLGEVRYQNVRLKDLCTDGRFNRPVSENKVEKILSGFNAKAFGALILWQRKDDGSLVILDGQHRVEAARRFGVPEDLKVVPAIIYFNLTLDEAAQLFVQHNDTRLVSSFDKYVALLTAGDPETLAIESTVRAHNLTVSRAAADGTVSCVEALRQVFRMGEPEGAVLGRTLKTIFATWGPISEAYRAPIIRGIGLYFHEHRNTDPDVLAEALVRGPGEPIGLLGWAKAVAGTQRMPLAQAISQVIEKRVLAPKRRRPRSA